MQFKGTSRPSKTISALAAIVGVCAILVGMLVILPQEGVFGWVWVGGSFLFTGFHLYNVIFDAGFAENVYEGMLIDSTKIKDASHATVEDRLRKLNALRKKGGISEEEYNKQREKIINEI